MYIYIYINNNNNNNKKINNNYCFYYCWGVLDNYIPVSTPTASGFKAGLQQSTELALTLQVPTI